MDTTDNHDRLAIFFTRCFRKKRQQPHIIMIFSRKNLRSLARLAEDSTTDMRTLPATKNKHKVSAHLMLLKPDLILPTTGGNHQASQAYTEQSHTYSCQFQQGWSHRHPPYP